MTFPNPKWNPGPISATLDAAAAVDKGGGEVGMPITGHAFLPEQVVILAGTVNYNGAFAINSKTANEIVITATYVAETFTGAETVNFGRQPIVKADLRALEDQIQGQPSVRMQPPLVWVDAGTVRIEATADCPAEMAFTGLPNIYNYTCQVSGGLSDSKIRSAVANVSCILGAGGFFGTTQTEKASQWYLVYALAADDDTDYELKAMPIMRVKSQAVQEIKCGTLADPGGTDINYAFTDDDLLDGMVYFLTGDSKGLMRTIDGNDVDTATRISYSGAALTVAAGDWFVVLPPATNFRMVGTFYNNAASAIVKFRRQGHRVQWMESVVDTTDAGGTVEKVPLCCPFAILVHANVMGYSGAGTYPEVGPPDLGASYGSKEGQSMSDGSTDKYSGMLFTVEFCRLYADYDAINPTFYEYPPGCGY